MDGYMIEVECDDVALRVHAKTKAARGALTGWNSTVVTTDDGRYHVQTRAGETDIAVPRSAIASATFKGANMMVNGNLVVTTTEGQRYQLHFRKKQQAGFEALARDLGAV